MLPSRHPASPLLSEAEAGPWQAAEPQSSFSRQISGPWGQGGQMTSHLGKLEPSGARRCPESKRSEPQPQPAVL